MRTLSDMTWKDAAIIEVRSLIARLEGLAGSITAMDIGMERKTTLESVARQAVLVADQIDKIEEKPKKRTPRKRAPEKSTPEYFIKISGKEGGYVDREGFATLDKAKAYRWGSRDGAQIYIVENLIRLGSMTLEEAPKRG